MHICQTCINAWTRMRLTSSLFLDLSLTQCCSRASLCSLTSKCSCLYVQDRKLDRSKWKSGARIMKTILLFHWDLPKMSLMPRYLSRELIIFEIFFWFYKSSFKIKLKKYQINHIHGRQKSIFINYVLSTHYIVKKVKWTLQRKEKPD